MDQGQSVLTTIITTDQNTGRQVFWNVEYIREARPLSGWATHHVMVRRPTGRKVHTMWVEIDPGTGQVIRNSSPRSM